jgi:hypothetical protein
MANLNAANGFTPVRHLKGGVIRFDGGFKIASALASDIFSGDLVLSTGSDKYIDIAIGAAGTASGAILGVFAGVRYVDANGDVKFMKNWISGTATLGAQDAEAYVYTDPDIVYKAQAITIAAANVGQRADMDDTNAGSAATGISAQRVDSTFGATGQLKVLGLAQEPDGVFESEYGANAKVYVTISDSELGAGGVAV